MKKTIFFDMLSKFRKIGIVDDQKMKKKASAIEISYEMKIWS